jgi:F0F1-type ATP synthase assembly protein I
LPPPDKHDDPSALAQAMTLSSIVISVVVEMILPGLAGWYFLDRWLGTKIVFLVIGLVLGTTGGMIHLVRMLSPNRSTSKSETDRHGESGGSRETGGRGRSP